MNSFRSLKLCQVIYRNTYTKLQYFNAFNHLRIIGVKSLSFSSKLHKDEETKKTSLVISSLFQEEEKTKDNFIEAIRMFTRQRKLKGHVDFIYAALNRMDEYGVNKDIEVYRALIDVMPKGKMVPRNAIQAEFFHYQKHQECIVEVLDKMEANGIMPDAEMQWLIRNIFGRFTLPYKKCGTMLYWMPKFMYASPWPLPQFLPKDIYEVALLAVARMCSVDPASKITTFKTHDVKESIDDTWIVSGQSPTQKELLSTHDISKPVYVEGPFRIYLRDDIMAYFILRSDPEPPRLVKKEYEYDDIGEINIFMTTEPDAESKLAIPKSVHEQEDGTIFALCITGTSSRDSLLSWVRLLQQENHALEHLLVLFQQTSPLGDVIELDKGKEGEEDENKNLKQKKEEKLQLGEEDTKKTDGTRNARKNESEEPT